MLTTEVGSVSYPRSFYVPRLVTFDFIGSSRFLLVGSEEDECLVFDLSDCREMAILKHQSKRLQDSLP
jgi:hypothetical protein